MEDRVGGEDALERRIGDLVAGAVGGGAGVWMVATQKSSVGSADLGLGGVAGQTQDGVAVDRFDGHDHTVGRVEVQAACGRGPGPGGPGPRWEGTVSTGPLHGCASGAGVLVAGSDAAEWNGWAGRRVTSDWIESQTGDHLPFSWTVSPSSSDGGERCRADPSTDAHRPAPGLSVPVTRRRQLLPGSGPPRTRRRGGFGGWPGHSAAMIASNSVRSRSSSAQTISRNCSSRSRAAYALSAGLSERRRSGTLLTPAQALMARRSSPWVVMEILRGLACSATGTCKVSTPLS